MNPNTIYSALNIPEAERCTSITAAEGEFIFKFLKQKKTKATIETGFAFGCSAAFIMSATGSTHYAIDPYADQYGGLGVENLTKLGLVRRLVLKKDFSHSVLPALIQQGLKFDFAFVDGDHRFDFALVDFHFMDLLLNQGGYILFHDIYLKSIQAVCQWIETNRSDYCYMPMPAKNLDFVLFQKHAVDQRPWDHFVEFRAG